MASSIQVETIQSFDDVQFRLANSWKGRAWDSTFIPTSWTTIRVGFCALIEASSTLATGNLAIGIGADVQSQAYGNETVANFVGAKFGAGDTWNYVSGELTSIDCYASVNTSGSGETLSGSKIYADGRLYTATNRTALFVEITRGSPNYTVNVGTTHGVTGGGDITPAAFKVGMTVPLASLAAWTSNYTAGTAQTVPVDVGTYGQFIGVNLSWDVETPSFRDCIVAVARIA